MLGDASVLDIPLDSAIPPGSFWGEAGVAGKVTKVNPHGEVLSSSPSQLGDGVRSSLAHSLCPITLIIS